MTLREYPDLVQGSEDWHAARRGIVTASVVGKLLTVGPPGALAVECTVCGVAAGESCISLTRKTTTPIKTVHPNRASLADDLPPVVTVADNETSRGLIATLAAERITGRTEVTPMTSDMWRGVEHEPFARNEYLQNYGAVEQIGFIRRDEPGWTLGYSPDGLVGGDGLIEIKAPRAKSHVLTVIADEVPTYYMAQCQAGLLVTGRAWIDYVPFVGGLPLWRKRVLPDPAWFDAIQQACTQAEAAIEQIVADYTARVIDLPATERVPDLYAEPELKLA